MKKFLIIFLVALGLAQQASAIDVYWTWPELRERNSDVRNALQCFLMAYTRIRECHSNGGTAGATCHASLLWFPEAQYDLGGTFFGSQYVGAVKVNGSQTPIIDVKFSTVFNGESGIVQRFFYPRGACEVIKSRSGELTAHFYGDP